MKRKAFVANNAYPLTLPEEEVMASPQEVAPRWSYPRARKGEGEEASSDDVGAYSQLRGAFKHTVFRTAHTDR